MPPRILIVLLLSLVGWCGVAAGQPVTRPSTRPVDLPYIPDPPKVTTLSGTNWKPKVFFDYNCTAVPQWNPKYVNDGKSTEPDKNGRYMWEMNLEPQEYLLRCGFTPSVIAYNGTLNLSQLWFDFKAGKFENLPKSLNRWGYEWLFPDGTHRDGDFSQPVDARAIQAVSQLARKPYAFGATVRPFRPVWTDIEGTQIYNLNSWQQPNPHDSLAVARAWLKMAKEFRRYENLSQDMEFYTYGGHLWLYYEHMNPDLYEAKLKTATSVEEQVAFAQELADAKEFVAVEKQHGRLYSGFTGCAYNWDLPAETDGENFYAMVDRQDVIIARYYPEFRSNKVMYVTPTWQIYWPQNGTEPERLRAMSGKPIPIELWKSQIDYLVSRGWSIYIWMGAETELRPIKPHIDYLLRFK